MDFNPTRRLFMGAGLAAGVGSLIMPNSAEAGLYLNQTRELSFYHLHTGEKARSVTYYDKGRYLIDGMKEINHVLRDHRTDDPQAMDMELLDQLYLLQSKLETNAPFEVISAYRSPKTNEMLRRRGTGVAKNSLHMQGKAIDVRVPGTYLKNVKKAALHMHAGGVGYYPGSGFVHLDTGKPRNWG